MATSALRLVAALRQARFTQVVDVRDGDGTTITIW
jgi:hypothetical protein